MAEEEESRGGRRDENTGSKRNKNKDGMARVNSNNTSVSDQNNRTSDHQHPSHSRIVDDDSVDDDDGLDDDPTMDRGNSRGDYNGQEADFSLPPPGRQGGMINTITSTTTTTITTTTNTTNTNTTTTTTTTNSPIQDTLLKQTKRRRTTLYCVLLPTILFQYDNTHIIYYDMLSTHPINALYQHTLSTHLQGTLITS